MNPGAKGLARLQRAFLRLVLTAGAGEAMGHVGLTFSSTDGGFTPRKPADEIKVKVLALEARPFFLEDDELGFRKLLAMRSLADAQELWPCLKRHRQRWEYSAFAGVMQIQVNGDLYRVVNTWFNCDYFHSRPDNPEELSLEKLIAELDGQPQAVTLLAHHLIEAIKVIGESCHLGGFKSDGRAIERATANKLSSIGKTPKQPRMIRCRR